jgi:hypothetical protein
MSLFKRPAQPEPEPVCQGAGLPPREKLPPGTSETPSKLAEARKLLEDGRSFAPHCDQRVLHRPGVCWACDLYPDWQKLRELWGIAFTGHEPKTETLGEGSYSFTRKELPCPADFNRPPGSSSDHRRWPNNRPEGKRE